MASAYSAYATISNMKKHYAHLVLTFLLVFTVGTASATAHAIDETAEAEIKTTTVAETKKNDNPEARAARVETYKKNLKETLTAAVKTKITEKCVGAQGVVKEKHTSNQALAAGRIKTYNAFVTNLEKLSERSEEKGGDVTAINNDITVLNTKIAAYNTANETYQNSLNDLSALDCKTDPVAFKAALEAARQNHTAVGVIAKDIRTFLTTTVKTDLQALKTSLAVGKEQE